MPSRTSHIDEQNLDNLGDYQEFEYNYHEISISSDGWNHIIYMYKQTEPREKETFFGENITKAIHTIKRLLTKN